MPSSLDKEIMGDRNNFKGTEYHLVYALWLLLYKRVSSVAFYQGNDLLAQAMPPPQPIALETNLHVEESSKDVWIQLKSTETDWNLSDLLRDNLLPNFICNALYSQEHGRSWEIQLVTQGKIPSNDIREFLKKPHEHSRSFRSFQNRIKQAQQP
ncbi:hypothetical protein KSF_086200 [Reticulibacter mediterranei]|uniref:Uncharacterized protein n=1 Tax=Reticulibacter mediterranei TaxID=2778369 RepID=A0A8J3N4T9_9CHLR|nr:hypothetical protein [Reticulibacter mediterranei]GHO98572.1 hypothetical protein KSF_086200 [Reticulibacter mediterranei]